MNAHTADPEQQFRQTGVRAAEILLGLKYPLVPTKGKDPYEIGWQTNIYPIFDLETRILNGDNIGVLFGQDLGDGTRLIALDVDFEDPRLAAIVRALLPDAPVRIGREPKFLAPLRVRDAEAGSRDFRFCNGAGLGADSCVIQVLGRGQKAPAGPKQAVVWGIHPGTQKPYDWRSDSTGRNIYRMRPGDWPLLGDLAGFATGLGAALEPLGWKLREGGHQSTGDPFEGVLSPRMIADARATLESELAALALMGPGTLRGTRCYTLGLGIGAVIKAGHIDLDQTVERLREAMPDNDNAWTREFQRGVFEAKGFRQARIGESENVDWAGAAKAQGAPWGEDAPGAGPERPKQEEAEKLRQEYGFPIWARLTTGIVTYLIDAVKSRKTEEKRRQDILDGAAFAGSLLAAGGALGATLTSMWELSTKKLTDAQNVHAQVVKDLFAALGAGGSPDMANYAAEAIVKGVGEARAIRLALMKFKGAAAAMTAEWEGVEVDLVEVEDLNKRFARFCAPGQPPAWVSRDGGQILDVKALSILTAGEYIQYLDPETANITCKPAQEAWRSWNGIHTFRSIVFTNAAVADDVLNLFHGFGVTPKAGDCGLILEHVRDVICAGDARVYERFLDLMAWQLQHVGEPSRVILSLQTSKHQVGKGIFFEQTLGVIWGDAFANETNTEAFSGRFNDVLRGKSLILLDETAFAGDSRVADALKRASTARAMNLEPKGGAKFSSPMGLNIVQLTNHEHAAHIEAGDARYWILDPDAGRVGDHAYFEAIGTQLKNGGPAAFLDLMLKRDVSAFVPQRDCPMDNDAKRDMTAMSVKRGSVRHWLQEVVMHGAFESTPGFGSAFTPANDALKNKTRTADDQEALELAFGKRATTAMLYKAYESWYKNVRGRFIDNPVMMACFRLKEYGFEKVSRSRKDSATGARAFSFRIPSRQALAATLGVAPDADEEGEGGGEGEATSGATEAAE